MRRQNPKIVHGLALLLFVTSFFFGSCLAYAETKFRESVVEVGISGRQYALTGKDDFKIIGNSGVINLGGGFIAQNYFSLTSLQIILGPYQPLNNFESRLDYSGTGFNTTLGWTWSDAGIRRRGGSFGLTVGMQYLDIVGRSVGTRTLDSGTIREQVTQIYDFAVIPGLFFADLKTARPTGNAPELLTTRLEGIILFVGVAFPIKSDYTQEYLQTLSGAAEEKVRSKGELEGRSYLISIVTPLGI